MNSPTKVESQRQDFVVIDDFLDAEDFVTLHDHVKRETFFYENSFEWNKVWHPLEGNALITGLKSYGATGRPGITYPTGTPYDRFMDRIVGARERFAGAVALEGALKFTTAAFLYRSGWGLPWHDDLGDNEYRGAFAYYLHDQWRGNWGGELMIVSERRRFEDEGSDIDLGFKQGAGFPQPAYIRDGVGQFVMPKPNRIVFFRQGILHCINRVSPLAGENMRFSLAGFFL